MAGKSATLEHAVGKLTLGFAAAGVAIGVESVKAAAKFQQSMELIRTQAGASQREVDKMSKAVLALAGPTATAPQTLTEGLYHLESAGFRGAKALAALKTAAEGAKIGGANLEDVTNALNATLVSGIKGAQNMSQAMGALNATVGAGDMRMQDLAEALGTGVLASVKGFGLSLNDVGAALATFGDNNIRGADAATQLRMAVLFMAKPAATAKKTLADLGLSSNSLAKDMGKGGLGLALSDLRDHLVKAGDTGAKMGQVLLDLFGHRAGTGIAILEQQYARFQQKQEQVHTGSRNFASDWKAYTTTFGYSWDRARASFESMTIQIGTKLLPVATKAMNWIGTTGVQDLDKFGSWVSRNKTPIEDLAKVLGTIAAFRFASSSLSKVSRLLGGGGALGGGGLGGILGSARPIPVYVTNEGFGGGRGVPGVGGVPGTGGIRGLGRAIPLVGTAIIGAELAHDYTKGQNAASARRLMKAAQTPSGVIELQNLYTQGMTALPHQGGFQAASTKMMLGQIDAALKSVGASLSVTDKGFKNLDATVKHSANDIDNAKSQMADFHSMTAAQRRAVNQTIAQFQRIPGAMEQVAAQAQAAGQTIGQALDSGVTIGIKQGSGQIAIVSTQVIDGVRKSMMTHARASSPSKMTMEIGRDVLAAGLALGLRAGKKGVGQAASELIDTVRGNVMGAGSLGNVASFGSGVDSLGASGGGGTSIANILAFTGAQVAQDRAFARNLAVARKHGLSRSVAQQIAMLGPDQGAPLAASIAGASRGQINQLNRNEAAISRYGSQIGGTVSLSDSTIAKLGRAIRPVVHQTTPAQLDRHNGKKILAHG